MNFREALEIASPDESTNQKNIDFLEKEISPKLDKDTQLKMKTIIDGLKQQQLAKQGSKQTTAQVSDTNSTAQISNNGSTAQIPNTSVLTKKKK